jgi:putative cell wall-binding protein/peptidoglycan hydrolase-like protein with peptidoglycan-binding domain
MKLLHIALAATVAASSLSTVPATAAPEPPPAAAVPAEITETPLTGVDTTALAVAEARTAMPDRFAADPGSTLSGASTGDRNRIVAFTPVLERPEFDLVAVTWQATSPVPGSDIAVTVRVRENGTWSEWTQLPVPDLAPDPDVAAEQGLRAGTDPLFVDDADAVQVRVDTATGQTPAGLQVTTIDAGYSPADEHLAAQPVPAEDTGDTLGPSAVPPRPAIITRAQWGADESRYRNVLGTNSKVNSAVIHHTAGSNSYTAAEAAAQVRGIYAYHGTSLGWGDIGYHFLVDKYGRIYEGRRGSITGTPKGAHAGGNNTNTMGVSAMGNYDVVAPPQVMVDAMAKVTGWKLAQWGVNINGTITQPVGGVSGSKYPVRRNVTLPTVNAHKDTYNTACPGRYLYPKMAEIRSKAAAYAKSGSTPAPKDPAPITGRALYDTYKNTVLKAGASGWAVRDLEHALKARGYNPGTVDKTWSSSTTSALRKFQGAAMLPLDDTVNSNDWAALAGVSYTKVVPPTGKKLYDTYGSTPVSRYTFGEAVRAAQNALNLAGYNAGAPDGQGDAQFHEALRNWQFDNKLAVDAIVQSNDWKALSGLAYTKVKAADRVFGSDRYGTATAVSTRFYSPGVEVAYLASGAAFPDALAGAARAAKDKGPVLLTRPAALPAHVVTELKRLKPKRIVILGGTSAVSAAVQTQARALATTGKVERLAGKDRYGTVAAVAATYTPGVEVAYVATGADFPDALAGAAAAGAKGGPVLLTRKDALPDAVAAELARLRPKRLVVLGSTSVVSALVEKDLARFATTGKVERVAGSDRYATAAALSKTAGTPTEAFVVSGADFPDALAATAVAGRQGAPVLLTRPASLAGPTNVELARLRPKQVTVVGGAVAVSTDTALAVSAHLR